MSALPPPLIITARTRIEPVRIEHADFFITLCNTEGWRTNIGKRSIRNREEACQFLEMGLLDCARRHQFGYYLISNHQQLPLGICGFLKKPYLEFPDFGFALLPEFEGQGFAFEASSAVLAFGLRQFVIPTLDAIVKPGNTRSQKLLQKLAFKAEGELKVAVLEEQFLLYRRQAMPV
ncbi:GNAT family N-acetyltransferase [Halioxenophilus sp. WMMB6]|uniref:GNAT family N-acetyltransferase n=1 Tax=Halioxenophilus sp. WMMB6 TaxID=3073815 RepID=UPI00295E72A8|nr:GNAT family N-acetyltransferase [Halioxenophilus sp. WMMB6]